VPTYVALLRGVNVGGSRKLPMKELAALLGSLGLEDVVTYIQSGNAVFRAPAGGRAELGRRIERAIEQAVGLDVTVVLRTPAELAKVLESNPFGADVAKLHVVFLGARPTKAAAARLDPERSPPDEFRLVGAEIYVRFPGGSGRSKLSNDYFERTLGVRATMRNWRTVTKLLELARAAASPREATR
jgi:uncharacterized protein (DUF1697 family)